MIQFKHTRVWVAGPHLGPLRTTLWAWPPGGCHHAAPRVMVAQSRRRVWPQALAVLLLIGAVSKAYEAHLWLGILVTVLLVGVVAVAVHALIVSVGGPPRTPAAAGPRDWTQGGAG